MGSDRWMLPAVALFGSLLVLFSTSLGIGFNVDSKVYLEGAEQLSTSATYQGFDPWTGKISPITRWPPGTSIVLTPFVSKGQRPDIPLRIFYAAMFFLNITAFSLVLSHLIQARYIALLLIFLFTTHYSVVSVHFGVYSEPFFLFCTFLGLHFFFRHLEQDRSWLLYTSAILIGLSTLFRYAGLFTIGGFILYYGYAFLVGKGSAFKKGVIFCSIALLPFVIWSVRNWLIAGEFSGREIMAYGNELLQLRRTIAHVTRWINPFLTESIWSKAFKVGALLLLAYVSQPYLKAFISKHVDHKNNHHTQRIFLLIALMPAYLTGYLLHIYFLDPTATSDERTLLPLGIYALLLYGGFYHHRDGLPNRTLLRRWVGSAMLFFVIAVNFWYTLQNIAGLYQSGIELNASKWQQSEILHQLQAYPKGLKVYSNETAAIYFHTKRTAQLIPEKRSFFSNRPNADLAAELKQMKQTLSNGGLVVIFREYELIRSRWLFSGAELAAMLNLKVVMEANDGIIYRLLPD